MFLEVTDLSNMSDWSCFVSHRLSVVNQRNEAERSMTKESQNRYSKSAKDWGWREFVTLTALFDQDSGFLVNDSVVFSAEVSKHLQAWLGFMPGGQGTGAGSHSQSATHFGFRGVLELGGSRATPSPRGHVVLFDGDESIKGGFSDVIILGRCELSCSPVRRFSF